MSRWDEKRGEKRRNEEIGDVVFGRSNAQFERGWLLDG
jgi:hypothetical protein